MPFRQCFIAVLSAGVLSLAGCDKPSNESDGASAGERLATILRGLDVRAREDAADRAAAEAAALFEPSAADRIDVFTNSNYDAVSVVDADFDLVIDFEARQLKGGVVLAFEQKDPDAAELILDTRGLSIEAVDVLTAQGATGGDWKPAAYLLGAVDPVMGAPLVIELPAGAKKVRIAYSTRPEAEGLQWLTPEQTAGGEHPFVYSQAQAIHARTMAPLQDTPGIRMTYTARLRIEGASKETLALMSARQDPDGARDGDYRFDMRQPVPPYLIALAAGDLVFKAVSDGIGVYAEADMVGPAAAEFADAPKMEAAAAALYGPYRWERYDMLVLPPSFPYGGMENPRLTFLTPTLVAGDKSLTDVVAHEIAHSWSGNLVTNATWRDAWLNEGFTTYVENRIMEALYGEERALMERTLDHRKLLDTIASATRPELTRLKLPADLIAPDEAFTRVAYIKGMFFLRFLEERFGRDAFDAFLRSYFDAFAFKAVVTEDFLGFLKENLMAAAPDAVSEAEIRDWILGSGLPETFAPPQSDRFDAVAVAQADWLEGRVAADAIETAEWSAHEWLHFINTLPAGMQATQYAALDDAFGFSGADNAEIAFAWYIQAIPAGYEPAFEPLQAFLTSVGRMKFIIPLYRTLAEHGRRDWAETVYAGARAGYHPIAQGRVDAVFAPIE